MVALFCYLHCQRFFAATDTTFHRRVSRLCVRHETPDQAQRHGYHLHLLDTNPVKHVSLVKSLGFCAKTTRHHTIKSYCVVLHFLCTNVHTIPLLTEIERRGIVSQNRQTLEGDVVDRRQLFE